MQTLLSEAANVMLTRYKGQLKFKGLGLRNHQAINDAECLTSTKNAAARKRRHPEEPPALAH